MSEDAKEKRRQTYLAKYGGEEGYRAEMRRRQQLSMLNPNRQKGKHRGGFKALKETNPKYLQALQQKGRDSRYGKEADQ